MFIQNGNTNSFTGCGYIDVVDYISNLAQKRTMGTGIILSSEKKKIREFLQEFNNKNSLYMKLLDWEKALSAMGKIIVVLLETKTGDLYLDIADPYFVYNSRVASFQYNTLAATIYGRFTHNDYTYAMVQDYTPTSIKRYTVRFDENNDKGIAIMGATVTGILPKYDIKSSEKNPFGFVPCWELLNVQRYPLPGRDTYNFYSDTQPARNLIGVLQWTIHQYVKELYLNKTRIIANLSSEDQQRYTTKANMEANNIIGNNSNISFTDDMFIKAQAGVLGENNKLAEILQGDPKLSQYWDTARNILSDILELCGYGNKEGSGVYKSEVMAYSELSSQIETTDMKRQLRQVQLTKIFDAILTYKGLWNGIGDRPYTFEIKNGNVLKSREVIDDCILMMANGLIDRTKAYSKINGVSMEESINAIAEIDKKIQEDKEARDTLLGKDKEEEQDNNKEDNNQQEDTQEEGE